MEEDGNKCQRWGVLGVRIRIMITLLSYLSIIVILVEGIFAIKTNHFLGCVETTLLP